VIDWPITYDDLEQYYCEAEHYIGVSGNSEDGVIPRKKGYPYKQFPYTLEDGLFIEAFEKMESPIGYSHMPIARYGLSDNLSNHAPCQTTGLCKYCPFGARFAAANYLDDLKSYRDYPNFTILQNSVVEEILMDSRSRASGVRFFNTANNSYETLRANIVVIASGAIEAPKLLQRSGARYWKSGIGNDNDLVGRYLISHPYFFYKAVLPKNEQMLQPQMGFPTLVSRHFDSEAEQVKGKFILINPPTSPVVKLAKTMGEGRNSEYVKKSVSGPVDVQLQGMIEVFSDWDNRVLNSDKKNRFGMLQTIIHHSKAPSFDARMNEIGAVAAAIFEKMGATGTTVETPVSWRADHAACTTRMSDDPEKGVVDRNLKVHGVDNLYVCSNASFASLGAVNPTLTLTALSLRLGDHLIGN
jgi:choline dehydrogenase-like flavoprotein